MLGTFADTIEVIKGWKEIMFHDATTKLLINTYLTCRHRCGWTDDTKNIFPHRGGLASTPGSPCRI